MIRCINSLSIYFKFNSFKEFFVGILNLLEIHYLLILFLLAILLARFLIAKAKKSLPIGRIEIKSVKPGDTNFFTLLFSVILPFYKFYTPNVSDAIYMACFIIIAMAYGITMKNSYHFNIVLKLFLGYSHYEIATTGEITYLMLSKKNLITKSQITNYVYLTNYMLLNVSHDEK